MGKHLTDFFKNSSARTVGIIFALSGLSFGTWASFIPFVKDNFHLNSAELGLLLLGLPMGNFIANPLTVFLIRKWGAVRIALFAGAMTSLFFALPVMVPSIIFASLGLVLAGASFGCSNVAMNTCASILEDQRPSRIMSSCHGMWSIGAMCGSLFSGFGVMSLLRYSGKGIAPQSLYVIIVAIIIVVIIWLIRHELDSIKEIHQQPAEHPKMNWRSFRPTRTLWMLISICLCTYLTEGTIADWSAVFMKEITFAPETIAGWGFAVYAFFMAAGRFMGDELIARFGAMRVLRVGGLLAFIGLVIVIASHSPWFALPGFMLIGMGISLASPILYGSAAKVPDMAPGVGLATLNTFAMASFLGGPVLIGFIAKIADLRIAFMIVVFASIIWIFQTTRVIRSA
ncbi:MAG: MFS transporter [Saprospiraceae bacterium]